MRSTFLQIGVTGSERDQGDPVQPGHARPGDRALQYGELVSEQGDLREQRSARAKDVRHEHQHGLEHGRARVAPKNLNLSPIREVARTTRTAAWLCEGPSHAPNNSARR
jgi:hypothetical protein